MVIQESSAKMTTWYFDHTDHTGSNSKTNLMLTVVRPAAPLQDAAGARRRGEPGGPQRPDADPRGGQARPRGPRLLPPPVRRRPQSQGDNLIRKDLSGFTKWL